jgi:CRISPR system Cascade subunit CasA
VRGGGPLTTLADPGPRKPGGPRTLWHLIWANVPAGPRPGAKDHPAIFPWLKPTRVSHGGLATTPEDAHPLQAFWGMPRRIRLVFEANPSGRPCDLTGLVDDVMVTGVVAQNYGVNYVAWRHPLTPYYRRKSGDVETLPVHAPESRIGFRQWLGMTYRNPEETSLPAGTVSDFLTMRVKDIEASAREGARIFAAGYAMDNAKALSFAEADMPLHATTDPALRSHIAGLAERAVAGTREVEWLLGAGVKRALYRTEPKAGASTIESVKERLWDALEGRFHAWLDETVTALRGASPEDTLPPAHARWLGMLRQEAFALFDDTAPLDGLGEIDPRAVAEARRSLSLTLSGYGPAGRKLYQVIAVPPPEPKGKPRKSTARETPVRKGAARQKEVAR